MEPRKRTPRRISGRLIKVLSASDAEREIEDRVTTDPEQEIPVDPYVESVEGVIRVEAPALPPEEELEDRE